MHHAEARAGGRELRAAEHQKAGGLERIREQRLQASLCVNLQLIEQLRAADQIHASERRMVRRVVRRKYAEVAYAALNHVQVVAPDEEALQPLSRDGAFDLRPKQAS